MAGKVTAVKVQARNKQRANVYLDGAFAFGLPAIVAARLRVGQLLTDAECEDLRRQGAAEQAYERALTFLSYRPRSADEVSRYLVGKQAPEDVIAQVLARLTQAGLLDDRAFARYWVENRESFRPRGTVALRHELRRKGIGDEAIKAAIGDLDETDAAYRAAQGQASRLGHADRETFRRRLGGFLSRRGFSYATVREVIERLWREKLARDGAEGEQPSECRS